MLDWLRQLTKSFPTVGGTAPERAALLNRYKQLRIVGLELNNRLVATLSRSVMEEGGRKLGIYRKGTFILGTEDVAAVLMDFCLHDMRRNGVTAIEQYLANSPPPAGSDERLLLEAARQARFTLIAVESHELGVGVHVRDLLLNEPLFVTDVGFGTTASRGLVMAVRLQTAEGITMTTGAGLPVAVLSPAQQAGFVQTVLGPLRLRDIRHLSAQEGSKVAAAVLRTCLHAGAAEHVVYCEPEIGSKHGGAATVPSPERRPRGKDPCPCGSGKKFKSCCGNRW